MPTPTDLPPELAALVDSLPVMLDVAEVGRALHRSPDSVRRLIHTGELWATRGGRNGQILVPRDAVIELLRRYRVAE